LSETDARTAREALERLLPADGFGLPPDAMDRLEAYVGLLLEANARLNLTRVVEPDAVARLHLLDALAALPLIDDLGASTGLDLGSGGGVPGIPLAIARPGLAWTLVDSVGKKADALRSFVEALGLANVQVVGTRAEVLGHDPAHRARYDLVAARACARLPVLVEYALPLLGIGAALVAWKGPIAESELVAGTAAAALLGGAAPEARASGHEELGDHRFVMVRKLGATPERFPRRPGEPARRPLPIGDVARRHRVVG
jgi:16S rRNA (guanine527-N7)-methyltransferase